MQRTAYKYPGQQSSVYVDKNTREHVCTMGREPSIDEACVVQGTKQCNAKCGRRTLK